MKQLTSSYTQPDSLLLLGNPGTGKSTFVAQLPNIFILDCDLNLAGPTRYLESKGEIPTVYYGNPYVDEEGKELNRKDWYRNAAKLLAEAAASDKIDTLCIDSLTAFNDLVLVEVLRQQGRKLGDFEDIKGMKKAADEQMQIQDWGVFFNMMKQIIFRLKATSKRIVFTGHVHTVEDGVTKAISEAIAIPGKTAGVIGGWFSEVWLLSNTTKTVNGKPKQSRKVLTFPSSKMQQNLGLKSSVGIESSVELDADKLIKTLCQTKTK